MTMTDAASRRKTVPVFTKLSVGEPVPTQAPAPPPTAAPAVSTVAETPVFYPTTRFGLADVQDMGAWILDCLQPDYPHLTQQNLAGWLRGCMENNQFHFIRTANAVGLAQRGSLALEARPTVEEVFVFTRKDHNEEAIDIYREFLRWAKGMNASEIHVGYNSDFSLTKIKGAIGPLKDKVWYVKDLTV